MSERRSAGTSERDQLLEIIFMFLGFTFATSAHSIFEEVLYQIMDDRFSVDGRGH